MSDPGRRTTDARVARHIKSDDPWFTSSQFAWAEAPFARRLYQARFDFLHRCLTRVAVRVGRPIRVLDAGCGDGLWLKQLAKLPEVTPFGVDYNPLRLERAARNNPGVQLFQADLGAFVPDMVFDAIWLSQVLEHVPDDMKLLRHLRELLDPAGVLVLGVPNEGHWLQRRNYRRSRAAGMTDHVHAYTETTIRRRVGDAGYSIGDVWREIFYPGHDRLFYALANRRRGFAALTWLTRRWPAGCSDYYFECLPQDGTGNA